MRILTTIAYGVAVIGFAYALGFLAGIVLGLERPDILIAAGLFHVPLFAYLMPKVGRPWWHCFGILVPVLNVFLFWGTMWRLAGPAEQPSA